MFSQFAKSSTVLLRTMDQDRDASFVYLGLTCIIYGQLILKRIKSPHRKKWTSTIFGIILMILIMGKHILHLIIMLLIGIYLCINISKRTCHIVVFVFLITYTTLYRIMIINEDRNAFILQNFLFMTALCKVAGAAFDLHYSMPKNDKSVKNKYRNEDDDVIYANFSDLFHYAFSYLGAVLSPYIRYRTFNDFLNLPFSYYSNSFGYMKKLLYIPVFTTLYFIFNINFPVNYMLTEEFAERSLFYKVTYCVIQHQLFKFWMYIGLILSECISVAPGLGAYPTYAENKSGHGPTKHYKSLKKIKPDEAKTIVYDFNTISAMDIFVIQTCPWISVCNRSWNKTIQYFMEMYIYKSLPRTSFIKPYRAIITILISAFWHGIEPGYEICMILLPIYGYVEQPFIKMCSYLTPKKSLLLKIFMFIMHYYIIGYGTVAFLLLDFSKIIKYYSTTLFLPYLFIFILYITGPILLNRLKSESINKND